MEGGGSYQSYQKLPRSNSAAGLMVPGVGTGGGSGNGNGNGNGNGSGSGNGNGNSSLRDDGNCLGSANDGHQLAPAPLAMAQPERQGGGPVVREQDRFMPIANVIRIMRKVLPTHAKISDDAKETIQECVSEYISFITSEANERCQQEQRKTITAEDVLWAMSKLGFDDYIEPLSVYLQRYREIEGDHRGSIRGDNLPPIKRSASADMTAGHLYGPPPGCMLGPHHHPHYHPSMFGGGGGGYYRGDVSGGGGAGPSQAPPPMSMLPTPNHHHLPPHLHQLPPFDPFASGSYK